MELLPCQTEAVNEFIAKAGRGYLVSSVGHGKSFVAAGCLKASLDKYPAPAWYATTKSAIREQVSKLRSFGLDAVESDRNWKNCVAGRIYVSTLEAISCPDKEWQEMRKVPWGMIVIDEADRMTAGASKRNRRLLQLQPRHRLMMTGTELRNGLKDAYLPVMWLSRNPPWRNWTDFRTRELLFQNPHVPNMITGIRDESYLASLMASLVIKMVNPDAPSELTAEVIKVELGQAQRDAYEKLKEDLMLEAKNGTLTISNQAVLNLKLRQLVAHPQALGLDIESAKEKALLELLPTLKGKTCIFTSFATVAKLLGLKHGWPFIIGEVSSKGRKMITDMRPDVLICTSAGERGVDMEWLTNIVSLDQGFTSATLRQRAGRATRYGRDGEAKLYLLQSPNTVDITSEAKIVIKKLNQNRKIWQLQSQG